GRINNDGNRKTAIEFNNITPVCSIVMVLIFAATVSSVWLTVAFTFDRFVAICCQKLKATFCSEKTASFVVATVGVLSCLESIPMYFKFQPRLKIKNVPWFCDIKQSYYNSRGWATFELLHRALTPLIPFVIILTCNALTVRHILTANKVRRKLRSHGTCEQHSDPEMRKRRKSIILLFSISGSLILLWMTYVVYFIYQRVGFMSHSFMPSNLAATLGYMLQLLSSCTNSCIYAVTQTKFREELKNMVRYPLRFF
uniref:G-protein coupled receptors family 1 profile domain-containing protein n=1 Tax=Callorhinchus milii TaxID=7868 RepID=A0A4W3J978_CALMI